jgi:hypothetical protein
LFAIMLVATSAQAETYWINRIGNFDYVNGSNGYVGNGQAVGSMYFYNDNRGTHATMFTPQPVGPTLNLEAYAPAPQYTYPQNKREQESLDAYVRWIYGTASEYGR